MSGWQPIDTAPRDGTPILAYSPVMGTYNTAYQRNEPHEGDRFPCGFAGYLGKWFCYPTHWMPVPSRPKYFESGANAAADNSALAKSSHEEAAQGAEND